MFDMYLCVIGIEKWEVGEREIISKINGRLVIINGKF